MQDRVPTKPNRALIRPEDGGSAFYATITRADEPTQVGDPLNKATFLKDETAALFGLDETAVPDDLFREIDSSFSRITHGSYTGTDTKAVSITVGFRPKFVLVIKEGANLYSPDNEEYQFFVDGLNTVKVSNIGKAATETVVFNDTGISWTGTTSADQTAADLLNKSSETYHYVAMG